MKRVLKTAREQRLNKRKCHTNNNDVDDNDDIVSSNDNDSNGSNDNNDSNDDNDDDIDDNNGDNNLLLSYSGEMSTAKNFLKMKKKSSQKYNKLKC